MASFNMKPFFYEHTSTADFTNFFRKARFLAVAVVAVDDAFLHRFINHSASLLVSKLGIFQIVSLYVLFHLFDLVAHVRLNRLIT